jgi:hypothetical protein
MSDACKAPADPNAMNIRKMTNIQYELESAAENPAMSTISIASKTDFRLPRIL